MIRHQEYLDRRERRMIITYHDNMYVPPDQEDIQLLALQQAGILQANIKSAIGESSEDAIAAIDEKLVELQNELLKQANAKKDYEPIADEIT